MSSPLTPLPSLLRRARIECGLTMVELAERIGRTHTAISRWESGLQRPTGPVLHRLIEVLGLDPVEVYALVERDAPPSIPDAIAADRTLLPEARLLLLQTYEMLLLVQADPAAQHAFDRRASDRDAASRQRERRGRRADRAAG